MISTLGYLYHRFNDYWASHDQPKLTVMDFEIKFKEFKTEINKELMMHQVMPLGDWLENQRVKQMAELENSKEKQHMD